jgi:hypothetical protein
MTMLRWKMPVTSALAAACFLVCAAYIDAPVAARQVGETEASLAAGTGIFAELNGGIDSKKAKVGDSITLHTTQPVKSTDDRMILPKGTKLVGHLTQSEARSKGASESALGIVFDKAILKDGREVPLNVVVQAMGAPVGFTESGAMGPGQDQSGAGTARSSPMGGSRTGPPSASPPTGGVGSGAPVSVGGEDSAPLSPNSRGVVGMRGLSLNTTTANNVLVSVVTSDGKNVRLDGGTRFLLVEQNSEPTTK